MESVTALYAALPSATSGVLLVSDQPGRRELAVRSIRRAKPNRDADRISPAAAVDIASRPLHEHIDRHAMGEVGQTDTATLGDLACREQIARFEAHLFGVRGLGPG